MIAFSSVKTDYFPIRGGVDLITPPMGLKPGQMIGCRNYEEVSGLLGAKRIDGNEVFDGRSSPAAESDLVQREVLRALITEVPGEGDVLGVQYFNGKVYAFRNAVGGVTAKMYASSTSGWVEVNTSANTLAPDGKYEFIIHNFYASTGLIKMFWVDGVNEARMYDGTTLTVVATAMSPDTPSHIAAHKNRLWLSFPGGSLQCSTILDPTDFSGTIGAAEFGIGDDVTAIKTMPGDTLAVFANNLTKVLYGSDATDWDLKNHSETTGAREFTVQEIGQLFFYDDRGMSNLLATDAYSNYITNSLSRKLQPFIDKRKSLIVTSSISKDKSQYRLFFSDNTAIYFVVDQGKIISGTIIEFLTDVICTCAAEDTTGAEVLYFGSSDGFVYQNDTGTSFNGEDIEAYVRLPYYHYKYPRNWKTFRKLTLELNTDIAVETNLKVYVDPNYSNTDFLSPVETDITISGGGIFFDNGAVFDGDAYFDGQVIGDAEVYIHAIGYNLGITFGSISSTDEAHTIYGAIMDYSINGRKG